MYWSILASRTIKKNKVCKICGIDEELQVDHVIPVAITGEVFDESNLQVLCKVHHLQKTKKDLIEIKRYKKGDTKLP